MNVAMILSGGVGVRMGGGLPKQFIEVLGKPVLAYTLDKFEASPHIDWIEVVCIPAYKERLQQIVARYGFRKVRLVVDSGETYQESVVNGLTALREHCKPEDNVLIHFGVSPFVSEDEIADSLEVCSKYGNAVACTPCYLCLCHKDDEVSSCTSIDRDMTMGLNSPQTFRFAVLCQLYEEGERRGLLERIEPHTTSLMFSLNERLYFSKSSQRNIKITTREDLELFEGYVLLQNKRKGEID